MKTTSKEIRIVTMCVILTLVFLFSFNIVYAYFTAYENGQANVDFYTLEVSMTYKENTDTAKAEPVANQKQLFPLSMLSRNQAVGLKAAANSANSIAEIGLTSSETSCGAYVRFYLEVFKVKEINGEVYYIDSKGNFVNESGVYVNDSGATIDASTVTKGEVVDYAQYFELGYIGQYGYASSSRVTRNVNQVGDDKYVAYFLNSALSGGATRGCEINAIKLLNTAPHELLDSTIVIYLTMESVQSNNNAYKVVFNDNYGYYNWG